MLSSRILLLFALVCVGCAEAQDADPRASEDAGGAPMAADAASGLDLTDGSEEAPDAAEAPPPEMDAATDAGVVEPDAGLSEEVPDSGAPPPCVPGTPDTNSTLPSTLSATGLYADIASKQLAANVETFTPSQQLWTDGAEKARFIALPACAQIDTSDMDHWSLPVGTKLWKEFRVGGLRVETRLIHRFGPGADDFSQGAYAWNQDESEATLVLEGVPNARGTQHDIPSQRTCMSCHNRLEERALGFTALQLSHNGAGLNMASLSESGRLTVPAPSGFAIPGDPIAREALAYLHTNCGHCHNEGLRAVRPPTPFVMLLSTADVRLETTGVMTTAVGVPVDWFRRPGIRARIVPGDPEDSCVTHRMGERGNREQMPPVGTERVDQAGLAAVRAFIEAL